jgi:hypothetical protein
MSRDGNFQTFWRFGLEHPWAPLHEQSCATEAMKRCDEALNASSLQFFASVKRFIASLL